MNRSELVQLDKGHLWKTYVWHHTLRKDSMVSAQKETCRPMKQNREHRKWIQTFIVSWSSTKVPRTNNGLKRSLFNRWWEENWIFTFWRMQEDPYLIPYTNINSKCIKDINIRLRTVKLLEGNRQKSSRYWSGHWFFWL